MQRDMHAEYRLCDRNVIRSTTALRHRRLRQHYVDIENQRGYTHSFQTGGGNYQMNRRDWMTLSAGTFAAARRMAAGQAAAQPGQAPNAPQSSPDAGLPLERFEPKSM